ncbi:MAG: histidinol-phosphatase [Proteobacteria bacterium]|nr:histidinol-phosphatase [Pseudomonadota bacterium]
MDHDIPRLLAFADTLADAARSAILPHFRVPHRVDNKSDTHFDPVTEADRASEQRMRQLIEAGFPDHGIHGEEFGEKAGASGYQWILDPIDGTRAFVAGLPTWGVLIGLYYEGAPLIGVMDQPYLDERYRGWMTGAESTIRGATRDLRTRGCAHLKDSTLSSTDPTLFRGTESASFERVRKASKVVRFGFDCYAYCMLASGTMDCVIESGLKAFDIAALIPIVTGAGGGVCNWQGGDASRGGQVLAYGDANIRDQALSLLGAISR